MARPFEPTPVLSGKDAERFVELTLKEERDPDPKRLAFLQECYEFYLRNPVRRKL